jgi:hypothetical protein
MRRRNRQFGHDARDITINEYDLERIVDLVDGLGWEVWELMSWSDPESGDQADRLQFLTTWRYLRNAVMMNRQFDFDSYGAAEEWAVNIGYIFRDGSAHYRRAEESYEQSGDARTGYRAFLEGSDPNDDA